VIAATNLASTLDPALQRPGRFDHKIEVKLPGLEERSEIIKIHLANKSHTISESGIRKVSEKAAGLTGAELENMINLAALQNIRNARLKNQGFSVLSENDLIHYADELLLDKVKSRQRKY